MDQGARPRQQGASGDPSRLSTRIPDYKKTPSPIFTEQREIGNYSIDNEGKFHHDARQLRKYVPPEDNKNVRFDVTSGTEDAIQRDETDNREKYKTFLQWIVEDKNRFLMEKPAKTHGSRPKGNGRFHSLSPDFVCTRGLVSRVLCVPYENNNVLELSVIKFRGTYFLCEGDYPFTGEANVWGYRFEQYVTADKGTGIPDLSRPINTNERFYSVVRSQLGQHSLVCRGEVDCVDVNQEEGNRYVELKIKKIREDPRGDVNFLRYKLLQWWAQSVSGGVPVVVCGYYSKENDVEAMVKKTKTYKVKDMPQKAQVNVGF
ncbi:decapping and exoribonuclease protein-like [Aplysia californica]|uniref:Decapping nuclease n=1 Tax=Aplysia californica TaxID=6500 RepID=A0ABM0JJS2_APLCA|nr:decapping and exoribonuclease protein-like [Aplysia californica]